MGEAPTKLSTSQKSQAKAQQALDDEQSENLNLLIQEVKNVLRPHIQERYGVMRVLDMTQPIGLESIYTNVNILEKITGRQRIGIADLLQNCDSENFDRFGLSKVREHRVSGTKAVQENSKLMILGKPGAGKTTFMKHLAIQCIWDKFLLGRIPFFVTLKDFAEAPKQPSLLKFINQQLATLGVSSSQTNLLLKHGRALLLFDGLDEVKPEDTHRVLQQIQDFCNQFCVSKDFKVDQDLYIKERLRKQREIEKLRTLIREAQIELKKKEKELESKSQEKSETLSQYRKDIENLKKDMEEKSRLINERERELSKEPDISLEPDQGLRFLSKKFPKKFYINYFVVTCRIAAKEFNFENFTEVEVADFDKNQIIEFSHKWFVTKRDPVKAEKFIVKLQHNEPIQELASNPLLLTLLCLVFEESADFPANRAELYKEGIDILLKKWDAKRNIERGQIYKNLSLQRKEDLLSKIAFSSFKNGEYFFKQSLVEQQIKEYIQNLPDASSDMEVLQLDCEAILKSIEAQHELLVERAHGIYSFSHLTFQEYFTARQIVCSAWQGSGNNFQSSLHELTKYITEKRWREVFLLTLGMLPSADYPIQLIKEYIDSFLVEDTKAQEFLQWLDRKTSSLDLSENPMAIRAFYFENALGLYETSKIFKFQPDEICSKPLEICLDYELYVDLNCTFDLTHENAVKLYSSRNRSLGNRSIKDINRSLKHELESLKDQLPSPGYNENSTEFKEFKEWWDVNGRVWSLRLEKILTKYRDIGQSWNFNKEQLERLKQYHSANKLLIDFLNSDLYISRRTREIVEKTILLPLP